MPEYLSKEEVRQWRSSLERITLEEYAARLGKTIEEEKRIFYVAVTRAEESLYIFKGEGEESIFGGYF